MFVDYTKIDVVAGGGGNGASAFRREKYVPRGGPSGGDGGNGGSVFLKASVHLTTLLPFRYKRHFRAQRGRHGSGKKRHGKRGQDLTIEVPVGTQVYDASSRELICDLEKPEQQVCIARGGRGGRGNAAFATSTNQAPEHAEPGQPGEERALILELKVLADVGLIGFPNAGKSTLISVLSAARPAIGDYPFTTLTPNLGVVPYGDYQSFVVADIPGLVEGAHRGSGLGDRFLRHVERTRLLVHLVDVGPLGPEQPAEAVSVIDRELKEYQAELAARKQILVASKMDVAVPEKVEQLAACAARLNRPFVKVSAVAGTGIEALKRLIIESLGDRTS